MTITQTLVVVGIHGPLLREIADLGGECLPRDVEIHGNALNGLRNRSLIESWTDVVRMTEEGYRVLADYEARES